MNKEYVPYELALKLKEIGFDIPVSYCYTFDGMLTTFPYYLKNTNADYKQYVVSGIEDKVCTAPTIWQTLKWFRDTHGLYVHGSPEFYVDGINFNWQILWYRPKEKWKYYMESTVIPNGTPIGHTIYGGTFMYGDNGEYPTQEAADLGAILRMIEVVVTNEVNIKINKFTGQNEA